MPSHRSLRARRRTSLFQEASSRFRRRHPRARASPRLRQQSRCHVPTDHRAHPYLSPSGAITALSRPTPKAPPACAQRARSRGAHTDSIPPTARAPNHAHSKRRACGGAGCLREGVARRPRTAGGMGTEELQPGPPQGTSIHQLRRGRPPPPAPGRRQETACPILLLNCIGEL
jgi:hypothetical protein